MEKHKELETLKLSKKNPIIQYETLDAALKAKNDMARTYLKTAKLP